MKKLFITLFAISGLALSSNAQEFGFKQGDVLLEGNIGFNSTNNKNTEIKTNEFNFAPKAGYFLSDKIAVGLGLNFSSEKTEDYGTGSESVTKENSFGFGVFGRYYFLDIGNRFKTYTEAGLGYTTAKNETEAGGTTIEGPKVNTIDFNLGLGANYFITERLLLNVGLTRFINVGSSKSDASGAKAVTEFDVQVGGVNNIFNAATFGLAYKF